MSAFIESLRRGPLLTDGGIGSYLFSLTGRISDASYAYEALNLTNPALVRSVHLAYLASGARCLTTNTFSASRPGLAASGHAAKAAEINRAGVAIAREAIAEHRRTTGASSDFFVLGSIGPFTAQPTQATLELAYREQAAALSEADALLFETFPTPASVLIAARAVRSGGVRLPIIVHIAINTSANGHDWKQEVADFVSQAASLNIEVVGVNCCAPWDAAAFAAHAHTMPEVASGRVLISAMPNVGGFERIGHRYLSRVTPEYLGKLARSMADQGVRLIGGCCEVHPEHIAEMRNYLLPAATPAAATAHSISALAPSGPAEKSANGRFSQKLFAGEFAVSVEIVPPRGTGERTTDDKVELIHQLAASGLADAIDITDGSRGIPLMPPGDFIAVLREKLGWTVSTGDALELIPHFTARDLNTMGLQSRLVGYHARRIRNVLFVTGDPPKMSPTYPRSTAVFDLNSVAMVRYAQTFLNAGLDFGGQPLGRQKDPRTRFTVGSGFEPEALDMKREMDKLQRKLDAGADYIFTQPVFREGPLDPLHAAAGRGARILVGVMVLQSADHARRVAEIPGVVMPDSVIARLARYESAEDQLKAGVEFAIEQVLAVRAAGVSTATSGANSASQGVTGNGASQKGVRVAPAGTSPSTTATGWAGLYLMSPASHTSAIEVLRSARPH